MTPTPREQALAKLTYGFRTGHPRLAVICLADDPDTEVAQFFHDPTDPDKMPGLCKAIVEAYNASLPGPQTAEREGWLTMEQVAELQEKLIPRGMFATMLQSELAALCRMALQALEQEKMPVVCPAKLMETLADIEHERWSGWMAHLFNKCQENADLSVTIPAEWVKRWKLQAMTKYPELSEREKESDRREVRNTWAAIVAFAPSFIPIGGGEGDCTISKEKQHELISLGAATMLEKCTQGAWQDVGGPEDMVRLVVSECLKTIQEGA